MNSEQDASPSGPNLFEARPDNHPDISVSDLLAMNQAERLAQLDRCTGMAGLTAMQKEAMLVLWQPPEQEKAQPAIPDAKPAAEKPVSREPAKAQSKEKPVEDNYVPELFIEEIVRTETARAEVAPVQLTPNVKTEPQVLIREPAAIETNTVSQEIIEEVINKEAAAGQTSQIGEPIQAEVRPAPAVRKEAEPAAKNSAPDNEPSKEAAESEPHPTAAVFEAANEITTLAPESIAKPVAENIDAAILEPLIPPEPELEPVTMPPPEPGLESEAELLFGEDTELLIGPDEGFTFTEQVATAEGVIAEELTTAELTAELNELFTEAPEDEIFDPELSMLPKPDINHNEYPEVILPNADEIMASYINAKLDPDVPAAELRTPEPEVIESLEYLTEVLETLESNPEEELLLDEEFVAHLVQVLEHVGCKEPEKVLLAYAKTHSKSELVSQLRLELKDLTKLIDYQQHLLAALNNAQNLTANRRTRLAKVIYALLFGAPVALAA